LYGSPPTLTCGPVPGPALVAHTAAAAGGRCGRDLQQQPPPAAAIQMRQCYGVCTVSLRLSCHAPTPLGEGGTRSKEGLSCMV
jgi:hypothetical protein